MFAKCQSPRNRSPREQEAVALLSMFQPGFPVALNLMKFNLKFRIRQFVCSSLDEQSLENDFLTLERELKITFSNFSALFDN